jgi:hypothetical protein
LQIAIERSAFTLGIKAEGTTNEHRSIVCPYATKEIRNGNVELISHNATV